MYTVHSNTIYPLFLSKTKPKLVILHRHRSRCLSFLEFPTLNFDFHLLTMSVNAKYYYQYTLILHRHHLINIYTELAPKLSATASVAQCKVEHWGRLYETRIVYPADKS